MAPDQAAIPPLADMPKQDWVFGRASPRELELLTGDQRNSVAGGSNNPCTMAVSSAQGIWIADASGRRYQDLYGNNCHHIGYRHPRLVQALKDQLDVLPFVARGFTSAPAVEFAATLARLAGSPEARVVAARSGADAIEIALAMAKAATGRYKTVSFYDSYHGRSAGALSVGGRHQDRLGLGPMLPGAIQVAPWYSHPAGEDHEACARRSLAALRAVFEYERDIAAVLGETIRNGPYVPPDWFWPEVAGLCRRHGALLILDEIATGLGKTGELFNFRRFGVQPDIVCLGKALGGTAVPLAAVIAAPGLNVDPGLNVGYFTHDKNPLCARAGLATLEIIGDERLAGRAQTLGAQARAWLDELQAGCGVIREIRSAGLMLALEFETAAGGAALAERVYRGCVERGVIPVFPRGATLTISAPLMIGRRELDDALGVLTEAIAGARL